MDPGDFKVLTLPADCDSPAARPFLHLFAVNKTESGNKRDNQINKLQIDLRASHSSFTG